MKIAVIANDALKDELLAQGIQDGTEIIWPQQINLIEGTGIYIDLLYNYSDERIAELKKLNASLIIINSINNIDLPENFIRINGWNTFLKRTVAEVAGDEKNKATAEKVFSFFNKKTGWVPNITGFITARIISQIINEAYFTLDEKVSTKEEIDIAMKLGTNYPYGPFEWSEKIGLKNVYDLLEVLSKTESRYTPSSLLKKEALSQ